MVHAIIKSYKSVFGSPSEKVLSRYYLLSKIVRRLGFRMFSLRYSPWKEREYVEVIDKGGYHFNDKKFFIYYLAKGVKNLEGDTVECGSFMGHGSWLILSANGSSKSHYIFDSFEGVSKPTHQDSIEKETVWKENDMAFPLEKLQEKLKGFNNVFYLKGWIPSRFNEVADKNFSFVHIDVDLYQPTKDSVEFFYHKMVSGGIILCDDYAAYGTPGARRAFDEFFQKKPENIILTPSGSGFIIKQ